MLDAQNNIKGLSENLGRNNNGNEKPSSRRKHSAQSLTLKIGYEFLTSDYSMVTIQPSALFSSLHGYQNSYWQVRSSLSITK